MFYKAYKLEIFCCENIYSFPYIPISELLDLALIGILFRYSIWLDSKLRLQSDPLLILEYFLWRRGHEYAISNHYDRHCVWEEVMQNKKLNKFNHSVIDEQFAFYQNDGLTRFNISDPNKLLPSCTGLCFSSLFFGRMCESVEFYIMLHSLCLLVLLTF